MLRHPNAENLSPSPLPNDCSAVHNRAHPYPVNGPGRSALIARMIGFALRQHQAGRFSEAEQIYRQILAVDADHADSLHLLGMIEYQAGNHAAAVQMIRRAIAINKTQAAYHSNLGTVVQSQGGLDEAARD